MRTILYIALVVMLVLSGCTEDLETSYKGKSDNKLVVLGEISTDTTAHRVVLSRTVDFNATEQNMETKARVTISDGETIYTLTEIEDGIYVTDSSVFGIVGKEYTLDIETQDGEIAHASSTIQPLTEIDSITVRFEKFDFFNQYVYKILFFGQEPAGKGNYYIWNLFLNDSLYNDTLSKSNFQSDDFVDGNYIKDFDIYWLDPEDLKTDTTKITVEMVSITESYFKHITDIMLETVWRGGPFDATPANVSTNIEGKNVVGFFAATNKKRLSIQHIKTDIEKNFE